MRTPLNIIIALLLLSCVAVEPLLAQTSKKKPTKPKKGTPAAVTPTKAQDPQPVQDVKPNLDVRPQPLAATSFEFPKYQEFNLPNGLHVYVIENHEQPMVTMSMVMRGGEAYDPAGKEGTAAIAGDMLGKGTKKRTALQIAQALDGVGAGISVSTAGESMTISASCIKKHANLVMDIFGEQLREPIFDEKELEKLKQQYVASVASRRSRPMEIAGALSRKVIYGMDNPLARRTLESTIKAVTRQDVMNFHANYIRPNSASLAIVGDVTLDEARQLITKYLGNWEKGARPEVEIPDIKTEPAGVYFVPRKGSVQSTIIVCAAGPPVRAADFDATSTMASYVGSGFGSLLFNTLRETYSYTYSPFSVLTRGRRYNRIACGAEVRSSVTDSALTVIIRELRKLADEGPEEDALARRIALEVGQYRIAFERPSTVAAVLQNSWLNEVPIDDVVNYTRRVEALTSGDIQQAAAKYLGMFDLRVVVVGSPDVRSKLESFGTIREYTLDLEPLKESALENAGMTVDELVAKHRAAIGNVDAVRTIKTVGKGKMVFQGKEYPGSMTRFRMAPDKDYIELDFGVMKQQQWVNAPNAWTALMGGPAGEVPVEERPLLFHESKLFPLLSAVSDGYKVDIKGKRDGQIELELTKEGGSAGRYYLDATTMLVSRREKDETTPRGTVTTTERFNGYADNGGVKLPSKYLIQSIIYSLDFDQTHEVNAPIEESTFRPAGQ
ncbi:MAG: insulinase family protein [Candidatus Kapabacteria bacterium]|nr:insulinase family protein [Candidatus Kapabacteria bacterium]